MAPRLASRLIRSVQQARSPASATIPSFPVAAKPLPLQPVGTPQSTFLSLIASPYGAAGQQYGQQRLLQPGAIARSTVPFGQNALAFRGPLMNALAAMRGRR